MEVDDGGYVQEDEEREDWPFDIAAPCVGVCAMSVGLRMLPHYGRQV